MSSKAQILNSIRSQRIAAAELPSLDGPWITYADRAAQFASLLESVGGKCLHVPDPAAIDVILDRQPEFVQAKKRISTVAGVGKPTVELAAHERPHDLDDADFAILPGEFGVCENGAIWVTDRGLRHRSVYFLTQHLALVLPASALVDNMHQAYQRLEFRDRGFGMFVCGPSKTADIEQSLVIGAHGPRSLSVFLVG